MQALGEAWFKLVKCAIQDSRPEASFRPLSLVASLTAAASAMEQAGHTGASGLQFQIPPNVFFSPSSERSEGQDPRLSLIGKLRSQERTGLCTCVVTSQAGPVSHMA